LRSNRCSSAAASASMSVRFIPENENYQRPTVAVPKVWFNRHQRF
jgi:hypothetical protein